MNTPSKISNSATPIRNKTSCNFLSFFPEDKRPITQSLQQFLDTTAGKNKYKYI